MQPRMHACSLQISRMASGDELRLNTFGCPGMARLVRRPGPMMPVERAAAARASRSRHTKSSTNGDVEARARGSVRATRSATLRRL